jgi:adenine phosphoribosyltransferase
VINIDQALQRIRYIPDYPAPGVLFQDITPVLGHAESFRIVVESMSKNPPQVDVVVGVEARGFILGSAIAFHLGLPFIPIRKKGKLPYEVISQDYGLEYGEDQIEIHIDAVLPGQKVLLIDDVLATGGTLIAAISLIERMNAQVTDISLLSEIPSLEGRLKINSLYPSVRIHALIS